MTINNQWDDNAKLYKCYFENDNRVSSTIVFPLILELLGDVKNKKILDLGCGQGRFSRVFHDNGANVIAYDSSKKELDAAISLNDKRDIKYSSDIEVLNYTKAYDIIFSFMVLLCNPYQQACELLKSIYESLDSKGEVYFVNTNTRYLGFKFKDFYSIPPANPKIGMEYQTVIPTKNGDITVKDHYYSPEHLKDIFELSKFKIKYEKIIEKQFILHILGK